MGNYEIRKNFEKLPEITNYHNKPRKKYLHQVSWSFQSFFEYFVYFVYLKAQL